MTVHTPPTSLNKIVQHYLADELAYEMASLAAMQHGLTYHEADALFYAERKFALEAARNLAKTTNEEGA